jgi:type IV secretory pathway VirB10-like protein
MLRTAMGPAIAAWLTENVYDSPNGRYLLIPQGSKLAGVYYSQMSFGQDRVLLVWTRLIVPNGLAIVLERQPGADTQGFTGLEDEVDQHWGRLAIAAALSTVLRSLAPPTTTAPSSQRSGVAPPIASTRPASRSCAATSTSSRPSPSGRDFRSASSSIATSSSHPTRVEPRPMAKLKLSAIPDDRPVKLTVELPAAVHRDLVAYAEVFAQEHGQTVEPVKLVPSMLARFMSTDRVFARVRRAKSSAS